MCLFSADSILIVRKQSWSCVGRVTREAVDRMVHRPEQGIDRVEPIR